MSTKQIQARFQSLHFELENLTSANQNLKYQLDEATTLLHTIRHSLGAQPGETALDTVNRVVALYQVRAENAQAEVRKFRDRNEVLGKLVKERSDERDALAAQVEAFGDKLSEVVALLDVDGMAAVQWLLDNCQEIESLTNMEPKQHLAEIRAQAGRDGFFKGVAWILDIDVKDISAMVAEEAAKQYADSIRKGVR